MKSILLLTALLCHAAIMACPSGVIDLGEKIYVSVEQIEIMDQKIYIHLEDYIYETPALLSDANGLYFDQIVGNSPYSWYEWECIRRGLK